jgi:ferric iron reductase protein FhuF
MNALYYVNEGYYDSAPSSTIIALSNDKNKLIEKMRECVNEDIEIDEDDETNEECNFHITSDYTEIITLQHNYNKDLYCKYEIQVDIDVI